MAPRRVARPQGPRLAVARLLRAEQTPADRWVLAGDQLYVDFDLSEDNVPAGTQLAVGSVVLEASAKDHTGCGQFAARFGSDAFKFVNSPEGARMNLRGINAKVIQAGVVHVGDTLRKI